MRVSGLMWFSHMAPSVLCRRSAERRRREKEGKKKEMEGCEADISGSQYRADREKEMAIITRSEWPLAAAKMLSQLPSHSVFTRWTFSHNHTVENLRESLVVWDLFL